MHFFAYESFVVHGTWVLYNYRWLQVPAVLTSDNLGAAQCQQTTNPAHISDGHRLCRQNMALIQECTCSVELEQVWALKKTRAEESWRCKSRKRSTSSISCDLEAELMQTIVVDQWPIQQHMMALDIAKICQMIQNFKFVRWCSFFHFVPAFFLPVLWHLWNVQGSPCWVSLTSLGSQCHDNNPALVSWKLWLAMPLITLHLLTVTTITLW